jgi:hypothetical protein
VTIPFNIIQLASLCNTDGVSSLMLVMGYKFQGGKHEESFFWHEERKIRVSPHAGLELRSLFSGQPPQAALCNM